MFEVGKLVARIALEGAQVFRDDLHKVGKEFDNLSDTGKASLTSLGTGMVTLGAGIIALASLAIARFASFDKAMSQVSATMDDTSTAGVENMRKLRDAAIEAGATSVYTAEEAAGGVAELARAGVQAADILGGGLTGSLALAAAGEISVAEAAEVASTAMTQFRLSGEQIPHLADLLAAGANKAQGGVGDLSMALKQSGLVAAQMGLSVEDTIGTLTAFASAGLLGSDAGTSFRTMLLALANPSGEAAAALKKYNIEAYDAQGNFVGIASLQDQLREGFKGVSSAQRDAALATIFGSDAIRAANVLYAESDKSISDWTAAIDENGAAARTAGELQNNLAGDVEKLGGAFDSALIKTGTGANDSLRDMVQLLTALIDAYGNLPPQIQSTVLGLSLGAGAILIFGGSLLMTIPKIAEFRIAVRTLGNEFPIMAGKAKAASAFLGGPWGIAIALAVGALGMFIDRQVQTAANAQAFTDTLDTQTGAITDATRAMVANRLQTEGAYDAALKAGVGQEELTDAILKGGDALDNVKAKLGGGFSEEFAATMGLVLTPTQKAANSVNELSTELGRGKDGFKNITEAGVEAAETGEYVAGTYDETATAVEGLTLNVNELIDALNKANGVQISAEEAAIRYAEQLREISAAGKESNAGISLSTAEGTKNRNMLLDLAKAGQDVAKAHLDAGGSVEEYAAQITKSRDKFIEQARALGATSSQANALADSIYRIPNKTELQIIANTKAAEKNVADLGARIRGLSTTITITAAATAVKNAASTIGKADGGILEFYANGGMRENHVAQIARAGTTRIWNEPETGGEGYIPLAESKRGGALPVLEQIASLFGFDLTPKGSGKSSAPGASSTAGGGERRFAISGKLDIGGVLVDLIDGQIEEYDSDLAVATEGRS